MTQPNVAHLNVHTAEFTPLADIEGEEAILYRSEDGTRIAGSFREKPAPMPDRRPAQPCPLRSRSGEWRSSPRGFAVLI